ncbi:hypothetical protein VF09_24900, partial [Nostoc linckia z9]
CVATYAIGFGESCVATYAIGFGERGRGKGEGGKGKGERGKGKGERGTLVVKGIYLYWVKVKGERENTKLFHLSSYAFPDFS